MYPREQIRAIAQKTEVSLAGQYVSLKKKGKTSDSVLFTVKKLLLFRCLKRIVLAVTRSTRECY